MAVIRLGLIGDNIARSQSPRLHVAAGRLCGLDVTYDRLIPPDLGLDFGAVFDRCVEDGYRGINITYPYKEIVVSRLVVRDDPTAGVRACNTVLFGEGKPEGRNTDLSGFVAAYAANFGRAEPGRVAMAGAGGVGKAVAFALAELGARELRVFDHDAAKARALADALSRTGLAMTVIVAPSGPAATDGADGLVNCTPLGMSGHPGTAISQAQVKGASWAFDAVYTPVETEFVRLARSAGLAVMSGWDLFFHQGIHAFGLFTGRDVDAAALRREILIGDEGRVGA